MVSRRPDAICFHCGTNLEQCDLDYGTYMNMTENERFEYKDKYKKRIVAYSEKLLQAHQNNKESTL